MRILIAVSCGPSSENIVRYGAGLAAATNGKVALVTVVNPYAKEQIKIDLADELSRLTGLIPDNIQVHRITINGKSLNDIGQFAEDWCADYVVVGEQNMTVSNFFFPGNFANRVLKACRRPLLIVPKQKKRFVFSSLISGNAVNKDVAIEYRD